MDATLRGLGMLGLAFFGMLFAFYANSNYRDWSQIQEISIPASDQYQHAASMSDMSLVFMIFGAIQFVLGVAAAFGIGAAERKRKRASKEP